MTLFVTAKEIIQITGIRGNTDTRMLNKHLIDAVQEEYVRPALGADLYEKMIAEVDACVFTGLNETLWKEYLKPVLSHYVWMKALPMLHLQTTNHGIQSNFSEFSNTATDRQRGDLADSIKSCADALCEKMIRYIEDNESQFPEYTTSCDKTKNDVLLRAGIIIKK